MNKLTLRIDNIGSLENGGPIYFELAQGSATVGRKQAMDWSLPDPTRHISGHHFDVTSQDGVVFVLHDRSSNGTFLQGDRFRLSGPHEIRTGDRFVVGPYIISADIQVGAIAPSPVPETYAPMPIADPVVSPTPSMSTAMPEVYSDASQISDQGNQFTETPLQTADPFDDVWGDFSTEVMSPGSQSNSNAGLQQPTNFADTPAAVTHAHTPGMQTPDFSKLSGSPSPHDLNTPPAQVPTNKQNPLSVPEGIDPFAANASISQIPQMAPPEQAPLDPMGVRIPPIGFPSAPLEETQQIEPQVPAPPPVAQINTPQLESEESSSGYWGDVGGTPAAEIRPPAPNPQDTQAGQFMQAFLEGAGVASMVELQMDPNELARIAGQCARVGTTEMMAMLHERAAVKLFMSGEDRTMRVAAGNNPMKFLPDPDQAFQAMFLRPRDGYMTGASAFQNSLSDIRTHQTAFIAALQPALSDMIDGLSPQDIENDVGGGSTLMGGGRRKYWDEFEKRWESRAAEGENGMLDAFIKAFSRHYSQAIRKAQEN